jgi:hypothetical protein
LNYNGFGTGWTDKVGRVGRVRFPDFSGFIPGFSGSGRVGSGTGYDELDGSDQVGTGLIRVGSITDFFSIFFPAPMLDLPVLTDHESNEFKHRSDRVRLDRF